MAFSVVLGLKLFKVDFTAAFLKTKSCRDLYFHPPSDLLLFGKAWLLLATAYGITEAARLFQLLSDETLTKKIGMEAIHGVKQLFVKRDILGKIQVLLAKQVDDNLAAGTPDGTAWFLREIQISSSAEQLLRLLPRFVLTVVQLRRCPTGTLCSPRNTT
jgi:hypothetical protein